MTSIETTADLVARIKAETDALPQEAIEEYRSTPFEFRWAWTGKPGDSDYTYQKKYTAPVVQARKSGSAAGGTRAVRRQAISAMTFQCPSCDREHSVLEACE